MLRKKMLRDILQNKSQFLTIFLMVLIGVMVYVGIEAYMDGMISAGDKFYAEYNLQDLNVIGNSFSEKDFEDIKNLKNINNAERKLVINATDADDKDKSYLVSFIETNEISKFYVFEGEKFDSNKNGVWIDKFYAEKNNLNVGDTIRIKYDTFTLKEKILGLVNIPDHVYDIKNESDLVPDRNVFGIAYLSYKEIPEDYIKGLYVKQMEAYHLDYTLDNFNYLEHIPYNYVMVDVNNKKNIDSVKDDIENNISSALAIVNIEDTTSYSMYQGEIDEGGAYVGIFSGLFLFIALLSVITTMNRVIKKQKLQIGTLKALGFKDSKITLHYISYAFFVSLLGAIVGIVLGRYFIGSVFIGLEMSFFEVPNGVPIVKIGSYLMALCVVLGVLFIAYLTCRRELKKRPAEALRNEIPSVKVGSLNITTKGIFKHLGFSTKWNLRDIIRNKFRTITGVIGIVGCCTLIVCAFGMLNSMNHFVKLQFEDLYNFSYKLGFSENISLEEIDELKSKYGNSTSETLGVEVKDSEGKRIAHTIFVDDSSNLVRFLDNKDKFIKLDSDEGVYITYKMASNEGYKIGDTIKWHIYGDKTYYETKIVGFYKDPQSQNLTMTKSYMESLGLKYKADSLYTNSNMKNINEIKNVESIQDISALRSGMESMLSMTKTMISLITMFAILLGVVIIYNMGILSYNEKQYQFATLKVLGFSDKRIKNIFIEQNIWITALSVIIGLPSGYYLAAWLFKACLDDNFDFGVHINISTYILATVLTFTVSYLVSLYLARKVKTIDMVSSLKGNE